MYELVHMSMGPSRTVLDLGAPRWSLRYTWRSYVFGLFKIIQSIFICVNTFPAFEKSNTNEHELYQLIDLVCRLAT